MAGRGKRLIGGGELIQLNEAWAEPLGISPDISAPAFVERGGEWSPQLHFTGEANVMEIRLVQQVVACFANSIIAHYAYNPFPFCFSVELQFGDSKEDREAMLKCRKEYHSCFTPAGKIKKSVAEALQLSINADIQPV